MPILRVEVPATKTPISCLPPILLSLVLLFHCAMGFQQTSSPSLDPTVGLKQYVHTVWQKKDGLPHNNVNAIAQTPDGFLWLGTPGGLVRFDGFTFTTFTVETSPELKSHYIEAQCTTRDSSLWAGTNGGGLIRYKDGIFTVLTKDAGLTSNTISSLFEDRDGVLWIGSNGNGINRLVRGQLDVLRFPDQQTGKAITSISQDAEGVMWFSCLGVGAIRYEHGSFNYITTRHGLKSNDVTSICSDDKGNLWIGMLLKGGLAQVSKNGMKFYSGDDVLPGSSIKNIYRDRRGTIWIGNDDGLTRVTNDKMESLQSGEVLSDSRVRSLFEDREGNLWIGTYAGGLNKLSQGPITCFGSSEGVASDAVFTVMEQSDGSVWIGTPAGLNRLLNGKCETFSTQHGLPSPTIWSLCEDHNNTLWIGTQKGLASYERGRFKFHPLTHGPAPDVVRIIAPDLKQPGRLWLNISRKGVYTFQNNTLKQQFKAPTPDQQDVRWIIPDRSGVVWIGTSGGVISLHGSLEHVYSTNEGLSSNSAMCGYLDGEGALWIGTNGGGLNRLKEGKIQVFMTRHGLFDNQIWSIAEDSSGYLWMSSDQGIFSVRKSELLEVAAGRLSSVASTVLGNADGMRNIECNTIGFPKAWMTSRGTAWFPTMGGAARLDLSKRKTAQVPQPYIESIIVDRELGSLVNDGRINPGKRDFEFHYAALYFRNPEGARFHYRLVGYDEDWIAAGARRIAFYTNLRPGTYEFQVAATLGAGAQVSAPASYRFTLEPWFYQTIWFRTLAIVTFGALLVLGYKLRTKSIKRRNMQLEAEIQERKLIETALKESEFRYRNLVDAARDSIFTLSTNAVFTSMNPAFETVTGWTREEWLGKTFLDIVHSADLNKASHILQTITHGEQVATEEIRLRHKSGAFVAAEITATIQLLNGRPVGMLGIARDVTNRKVLEEQIRQAQKLESLGTLAGGIAHDFNNLLNIIVGHIGLIQQKQHTEEMLKKRLVTILEAAERGAALVRQLLTFARKTEILVESVRLNEVITQINAFINETFPKSITIRTSLESSLPSITADPNQIHQVLLNLCVNARDAMPAGGELVISTRLVPGQVPRRKHPTAKDRVYIEVDVLDTGTGMDEATIARIFEPFYTTKGVGKGSGLGLAVAFGIVQNHGGFIDVESNPGHGTVFHLWFPAHAGVLTRKESEQLLEALPNGSETILFVEDEEMSREMVKILLEERGFTVLLAADGEEGVAVFAEHWKEINLVITDLGLPKLGGLEAFKQMKRINPAIQALLISGYVESEKREKMIAEGIVDILPKPFQPTELLRKIRDILGKNPVKS